jgi:hypothetical protein
MGGIPANYAWETPRRRPPSWHESVPQRVCRDLGQRNISGVISSEVVPQLPDAIEKGLVRISRYRQVHKVRQRFACPLAGMIPGSTVSTENLGYFEVGSGEARCKVWRGSSSRRSAIRATGVRNRTSRAAEASTTITVVRAPFVARRPEHGPGSPAPGAPAAP